MATTKNLCAQIPIALHERVSEERERLGETTSEYIANLIQEYPPTARNSSTAMKPKRPTTPRRFRTTLIGRWRAFTQMRASPEPASKRERSSIR